MAVTGRSGTPRLSGCGHGSGARSWILASSVRRRAKLVKLDAARALNDLRVPPANRLEALRGDRVGQHSIRINQQWRICFSWTDAGPAGVEIEDYHEEVVRMSEIDPVHPGEVLLEEFLEPLGLTQHRLAAEIGRASADQRDFARQASDHREHGGAVGKVLRHHGSVLAEPADPPRTGGREGSLGGGFGRDPP